MTARPAVAVDFETRLHKSHAHSPTAANLGCWSSQTTTRPIRTLDIRPLEDGTSPGVAAVILGSSGRFPIIRILRRCFSG